MLILTPGSVPLYAPGKLTVGGLAFPPPVILSCAHSICVMKVSSCPVPGDFGSTYVELSAGVVGGAMESDQLYSHQVLTGRDAVRDGVCHLALILDEAVHSPNPTGVKAIVVNLEPFQTGNA